jgi:hypothetical protein
MDISIGAPEAHPFGPNQRPASSSQSHIRTSHPSVLGFIPGVVPALLSRPESHSP